ncbi:spore germination protein [Alicyclobacillus sp.]|uniref:spore germination protein n=1 Tax=Alicyclobacillus sp. TaxID=61169 RepID=UPI0025BC646F|nr:spore germination protein [Alicyclobacillus sp.]MCL6516430.1 spore germination protein [Alicyclobacillus sp.]
MTVWNRWFGRGPERSSRPPTPSDILQQKTDAKVSGRLDKDVRFLQDLFGRNDDFVIRTLQMFDSRPACLLYFSNLVNRDVINEHILKPLMGAERPRRGLRDARGMKQFLAKRVIYYGEVHYEHRLAKVAEALLRGETILLVEGLDEALHLATRNVVERAVEQPETEQVIRGGRDGFTELLATNVTLLRYRLQTPNFRVQMLTIGRATKTKVGVCYVEGVANDTLVQEVLDRLQAVDVDGVIDAGTLEQFIEDNHWSPFPQIQNTERPDKCVATLLEGRVVILTDGTPFALIVPAVFTQFYQTLDDYTERPLMASLIRMVRIVALIFSLVFPSLYVSVIAFNPELIPTKFAVAVAGGRAGVPFPAVVEVLVMEVTMEVLREATLRLPQQVGGALSIVGVLVVGQAAVAAGFASPITVVVVALTTIGSFATPAYNAAVALRILRFVLTVLAGIWGLYGVMLGLIAITHHMLSLRSFGVPYLSPIVPGDWQGLKDSWLRAPLWWMPRRPRHLFPQDPTRLAPDTQGVILQRPSHPLDPVRPRRRR